MVTSADCSSEITCRLVAQKSFDSPQVQSTFIGANFVEAFLRQLRMRIVVGSRGYDIRILGCLVMPRDKYSCRSPRYSAYANN